MLYMVHPLPEKNGDASPRPAPLHAEQLQNARASTKRRCWCMSKWLNHGFCIFF